MALVIKNWPANAGDMGYVGSIPGLERSPGGGTGKALQNSCLGNPLDRGARRAIVHRVRVGHTGVHAQGAIKGRWGRWLGSTVSGRDSHALGRQGFCRRTSGKLLNQPIPSLGP